jgi:hypothetical protein
VVVGAEQRVGEVGIGRMSVRGRMFVGEFVRRLGRLVLLYQR